MKTKDLTLRQAVAKITCNPARILNINAGTLSPGADADIAVADLKKKSVISPDFFASKSKNSPFIGAELTGSIEMTLKKGKIVYMGE